MAESIPVAPIDDAHLIDGEQGPTGWWRVVDTKIGIVPVPVFIAIVLLIGAYVARGKVPSDLTTNILILAAGGFACAEIGKHIPGLKKVGAAAILATFVPSLLVYLGVIPKPLKESIATFTDQSNFLYLFIGSIIVGSILGMDRKMLIGGFLRILVPILSGSVAAAGVGCAVGTALGMGLKHTAFMVVVPVLGGGVGEGAIPLSIGYAALGGGKQGDLLAEILPAVMFGSLAAILLAGALNLYGKRRPDLTGEGQLQPGEHDLPLTGKDAPRFIPDLQTIGGALLLAMTLYLAGALVQDLTKFPGPVTMLFLAVILKLGKLVSPRLEQGAYRNYQFFAALVTYPLLFAIGVAKTPWEKLMSAFNMAEIATILATVVTLVVTGFFTGRLVNIHPIESGIVTACRASQGGTGDVAILSASNRMVLMPFAQVATRIGGALTVTLALALFAKFGA
ncbi:2-hydroxycarboxylate transporter family protein [Sphingomonas sp. AR_OL41]|uniref:2-hydroxycarboxylate transporter family protein n=1 Tax=Sphingomonas sp. AR_OL41 TaxID=3042729 RepID=UPI0024802DD2|nr:2-hydroxycarboxylate transporter family protein [Sphingomonas sp. AR_OL41]MDH7974457.1 2-hydroxycarboxylate transporter family protein [Sphingomonas sp. AR_OL41]